MFAYNCRRLGWESLEGNWPVSILVAFLAALLCGAAATFGVNLIWNLDDGLIQIIQIFPSHRFIYLVLTTYLSIFSPVTFIIGGTIQLGHCKFLLNQYDFKRAYVSDLFSQFNQFGNGFCLQLLTGLFKALWGLLFIIPGIIAGYRYAMAPFIQAEHPEYTASESINASKELMYGHKFELFCLDLSFIGWSILCIFTLGIGGLFLAPYVAASRAAFYRQLCPAQNIIDAQ